MIVKFVLLEKKKKKKILHIQYRVNFILDQLFISHSLLVINSDDFIFIIDIKYF